MDQVEARREAIAAIRDRAVGALVGLAVGDALGAYGEFKARHRYTITGYRDGGTWGLKAGQYTDDASMALCLAESLLAMRGLDDKHALGLWLKWYRHGYNSSTGRCFDIGGTTREALQRFEANGSTFGPSDEYCAGNGAIMRLAPAAIACSKNPDGKGAASKLCTRQAVLTHHAQEAMVDSAELGSLLWTLTRCGEGPVFGAMLGRDEIELLLRQRTSRFTRADVRASGRSSECLNSALWIALNTGSFEEAVLRAAGMGEDSDTLAAVVGQIAGAMYGFSTIPDSLYLGLQDHERFKELGSQLFDLGLTSA